MLVDCSALAQTLAALNVAAAIAVTGTCPAYVKVDNSYPGSLIDFSQANAVRVDFIGVSDLTIQNFNSVGAPYGALNFVNVSRILVSSAHLIAPGTAGVTIQGSDTVEIAGAWISQSSGDGIDVVGSTNINIHDGACENNVVTLTHPDCVQGWSLAGAPLTHIFIQNEIAIGQTQGFDIWDPSDLGATDIQFLNNHAALTSSNCIGAWNIHNLVISGNDCHTLLGANGPPGLYIRNSPSAVVKNNSTGSALIRPVVQ